MYEHLRRVAHGRLRSDPHASLNTTDLVHEAYLKLARTEEPELPDSGRFLALASRVMRNLLVDRARARKTSTRTREALPFEIDAMLQCPDGELAQIADLDDALVRLESFNERRARILEQRYFGGLTLEETASALGVSLATVKRELRSAHAWLAVELGDRAH
jgi:RNA polymerase sigma factor (TIGR02999 family)